MKTGKHFWECEECNRTVAFRDPELPQEAYSSEQNESKKCAYCGGEMYFEEEDFAIPPHGSLKKP